MISILSTVALLFSLLGNILVNTKNKKGFIVWCLSNILWIIINVFSTINIQQIIMFSVFTLLNVHGYINWSKNNKTTTIVDLSNKDKVINYCKNVCSVDESHLENAKHNLAVINGLDSEFEGCPSNYGLTEYEGLCEDYDDNCCEECWRKALNQ